MMKIADISLRIEKLVPGADYGGTASTQEEWEAGAIRWNDARPKPTWAEIVATVGETAEERGDRLAANLENGALTKTLVEVLYRHENRLRALEGKASVTKQQVLANLKTIYKGYL